MLSDWVDVPPHEYAYITYPRDADTHNQTVTNYTLATQEFRPPAPGRAQKRGKQKEPGGRGIVSIQIDTTIFIDNNFYKLLGN